MTFLKRSLVTSVSVGMLLIGTPPGALWSETSLRALPDGEHYYQGQSSSELLVTPYALFHKWGRIVVGIEGHSPADAACFKGFLEGHAIVDATRVLPPYTPDAEWNYQSGLMLDLSQYEKGVNPANEVEREALEICLDVFSR